MQYVFRMRRPCDLGRMYETSCPPKATPDPSDSLSRPPGTCCRAIALDLTGRWLRAELKTVCRSGDINCYMREVFLARKSKTNAKISSTGRYRHCQQSAERQDMPCGGPSCDDIVGAPGECFSSNRVRRTDWRAALAIGCAIPPKAAISIQAQCFGHSGTCRALNRGFLRCSPRLLTQSRLAPVRLLK